MDEQFGFQTGHSKDHAIAQLVDQIYEAFEKNEYKLGLFIDLSKAFDTVDHSVLLRKLELNHLLYIQLVYWILPSKIWGAAFEITTFLIICQLPQ